MKRLLLVLVLLTVPVWAQTPTSPLSELDRLKGENFKLRAQVLDLQRQLAQIQLTAESQKLQAEQQSMESAFRALLKPATGEVFDWETLTFKPPPPPVASNGTKP